MRYVGGAGDGDDVIAFVQQPGQRELRRGAARLSRYRLVGGQQLQVGRVVGGVKTRHGVTDVFDFQRGHVQLAGEETTRHRAEGHKSHTQLAAGLQHGNLGVARPQRVLGLQGGDGVHSVGAAQRAGRHFGQAQCAHLAFFHQTRHFAHAVFNGYFLVETVQVVEVNDVGLQAAQAVFAVLAQRRRSAINHALDAIRECHARQATLAGQGEALTVGFEHLAQQGFVGPKAIQCGGVKQRDTGIQRGQQHALSGFMRRGHAVGVAQAHAAQTEGRDLEGAEFSGLHRWSFL